MDSPTTSRFTWAIAEMVFRPGDKVLEIGPGTGIALELIATQVSSGHVVAVDQSRPMLAKTESRLKKAALDQRVTFIKGKAETANLSGFHFDKVFAFNVNIFLKPVDLIPLLDPIVKSGVIGIFYQNPPGSDRRRLAEMLEKVKARLNSYHFEVVNIPMFKEDKSTPTGGVVARKK